MSGKNPKAKVFNILFAVLAATVVFLLWRAPEETTSRLPDDEIHEIFHKIKSKKEADSHCVECHSADKDAPLPEDHPPPYRCLFCHKRR